jgi:hypothetical protein
MNLSFFFSIFFCNREVYSTQKPLDPLSQMTRSDFFSPNFLSFEGLTTSHDKLTTCMTITFLLISNSGFFG